MSVQSHDAAGGQISDSCQAEADGPDDVLLCWLPPHTDGDHWDMADKVHWSKNPDLVITPCTHQTAAT